MSDVSAKTASVTPPDAAWRQPLAAVLGVAVSLVPVAMVWDNGGLIAWTRYWASLALAILGAIALPLIISRSSLGFHRVLWVPTLAALAWLGCLIQTVPLPTGLVQWLSPGAAAAYQQQIPDVVRVELSESGAGEAEWVQLNQTAHPISVSQWKTTHAMYLPALFGLGTLLGIFSFTQRQAMTRLLLVGAVAGGLFAFLALADSVRGGRKDQAKLITPMNVRGAPFGSFVNRNSAGLFINLGLACTVGLLVTATRTQRRSSAVDESYELPSRGPLDTLVATVQQFLKDATGTTVALFVLSMLQIVAILASQSRGAFLAAIAGLICVVAATSRKGKYVWMVPLLLVAVLGVLLFLEQLEIKDRTAARLQSIFAADDGSRIGRLKHWKESLITAASYLPLGSGLGTYSLAYLPYQEKSGAGWFYNADNMFCEWLVEGGVWLLGLIAAGTALVISSLRRLRRVNRAPHLNGLMATGWYLVTMLAVSQFFDFGILYPANFFLVSLLVGSILAADSRDYLKLRKGWLSMRDQKQQADDEQGNQTPRWAWPWRAALGVAYAVIIGCTVHWAHQDAWTDYEIRTLSRLSPSVSVSEHPLVKTLLVKEGVAATVTSSGARPVKAVVYQPFYDTNPELQIVLARALLSRQEQLAVTAVAGKLATREIQNYERYVSTDYRRSVFYSKASPSMRQIRLKPDQALLPGQSLDELRLARRLAMRAMIQSPLDVMPRYVLLQTGFVVDEPTETTRLWVEQSQDLWPESPSVLLPVAKLAAVAPGDEVAERVIADALRYQPKAFKELWPFIERLKTPEARERAVPDEPRALIEAVEANLAGDDLQRQWAARLRAIGQRGEVTLPESEWCFILARLERHADDLPATVVALSRGVLLKPDDLAMRYMYCEVLEAMGDLEGAIEQARACVSQSPKTTQYQQKLRELMAEKRERT